MARTRQVTEIISDDLDGSTKHVETITFAIDGDTYEIDLGPKNAKEMRRLLATYTEAGRKVQKTVSRRRTGTAKTTSDSKAIRQWAAANGIEVPTRGRIPSAVAEQYARR